MRSSYDESMPDVPAITPPSRKNPTVRAIVSAWRALTGGSAVRDGGRRTLVACSGGADSSALLLALASVRPGPEVCHVIHDMRPAAEAEHDADRTGVLCDALGVRMHRATVRIAGVSGNPEANARSARYAALAEIARSRGLRYVATGHHADDQLETVLMRLVRGAGVRGMAGIREQRRMCAGVDLVRPMLGVSHAAAADLCDRAGWAWNEDATNADVSRMRSAIRASVLPALRAIEPEAAGRAARTCASMASADRALDSWARGVLSEGDWSGSSVRFQSEKLVVLPDAVLVSLVGLVYHQIVGVSGRDRLSQRVMSTALGGLRAQGRPSACYDIAELELRICEGLIEFCKKCD